MKSCPKSRKVPERKKKKHEGGYVRIYQDRLTALYIEAVRKTDPDLAALLDRKTILEDKDGSARDSSSLPELQRRAAKAKRRQSYIDFWNMLTPQRQLDVSCADAKINTIRQAVLTMAVTDVVQAHNSLKATTAGSIDFVIERFRAEGLTASQVQQFLDENGVAWFSLTSHPTNPATVEYSLAEIALCRVLADSHSTQEDLERVLHIIRDVEIVGERKTPIQEVQETLGTLEVIYDVALKHKALFDAALKKHNYDHDGVKVRKALVHPCSWSDGDGNENITAKVLVAEIALRRDAVRDRYLRALRDVHGSLAAEAGYDRKLKSIENALNLINGEQERMPDLEGLIEQIDDLVQLIEGSEAAGKLSGLSYLLRCFGFCFGTIDLRHNAVDIMKTVARLLDACGILAEDDFDSLSELEKESALTAWLADDALIETCAATDPASLEDDTAARIFERLQVVGKNPDVCEKLIIAETTHAAHALAALLLLKVTGNEVGTQKSRIDIVTLSESVADLMGIGMMLEALLGNASYRAHVAARGRMIVMVAKSDTTRLDGRGAAEYAQNEAAVTAYGVIDRMKGKFPELEYVQTSLMNGGGLALQRGGGRVTEVPALHGRAAADARASDIGPSTLTIQGHQQRILFEPYKTAIGTLEALAAQNLYSKAGIHGEMPPPAPDRHTNKQYARADAWLFARTAREAYERLVKDNPAIDELLTAAPWLSMKAGNVSSRPAKRGEKMTGPGITPREAKGDNPKALQGRAISGERLSAHACLPVFTVLGQIEAMNAVKLESQAALNPDKYGEPLYHLYRSNKIHRDGARVNINAAPIADFDLAWPLLTGQERPDAEKVTLLAKQFRDTEDEKANTPDVTLAFMEEYFLEVEKMTWEMVTGQKVPKDFRHGDGLKKLWPELAEQVEYRNRCAEFARTIETWRSRQMDAQPDRPLDERDYRITQALYTAADVIDAPAGILATRTRLEPVRSLRTGKTTLSRPQSFSEKAVGAMLTLPRCLASA